MKIGIIGNGIHSKRIQKILRTEKIQYLIYKPNNKSYYDKTKFEELKKCDAYFIISINKSHFFYIKKLISNKFIFCEKPPVTSNKDLKTLVKMNNNKIYFNFNFRFSKIAKILEKRNKYKLGNLLYANIISSHGLSYKKEYISSWRSNIKKNPKGVFETVSIHFIDLINYFFNIEKLKKPKLYNKSGIGSAYDTAHASIILKKNILADIFVTYKSALNKKLFFLFENGIIEQNNNQINIKGPARNFNKEGFFKYPKTIAKYNVSDKNDYTHSLKESVLFFLKHAKLNKKFKYELFKCSVLSNQFLLK